jgi:hypothetical protein
MVFAWRDIGMIAGLCTATAYSSEQSAMRCTDVSTGHFFRVSRESYELG